MTCRSGCVQVNELIPEDDADCIYPDGKQPPIFWKTAVGMSDYLNSTIGCCTDHAFLTKTLLEEAGFESRRVLIPWHWLTEVFMGSSWNTIDATGGLMINTSTESMVDGMYRKVYMFITPYMYFDSADHYSPLVYPAFPSKVAGLGLEESDPLDKSLIHVILGYYNDPPYRNESALIN